ncbi:hypothetical protein HDU97_008946 [Phlyctochytrium planicorne]|nr:hypothetical protein HDU97_008946 [Phlyctochytrium planicorne]
MHLLRQLQRAGPSIIAFLTLIFVQVTIGIIYKLAGASGKYKFSAASSLAISEFVKLLLSYGLLIFTYEPATLTKRRSRQKLLSKSEDSEDFISNRDYDDYKPPARMTLREKWKVCNEIIVSGFGSCLIPVGGLAVMYGINNHFAFSLFLVVDPGTISLVKSASTFISAFILYTVFGRMTNRLQWLAIALQAFGIITSQYDPCKGGTIYPVSSYALLFISVSITALAGCINDNIMKTMKLPLHAINIYLYGVGFLFNLAAYHYTAKADETAGFFDGYDTIAIMVVFLNCVIGLVITAVYKYADAVMKTIGQTISTGILLVLSAFLFGSQFGVLQFAGVMVIFLSVYLYFVSSSEPMKKHIADVFGGATSELAAMSPRSAKKRLITGGFFGILAFGFLTHLYLSDSKPAPLSVEQPNAILNTTLTNNPLTSSTTSSTPIYYNTTVTSFYKDILVVVNWNNARYHHALYHWREIYPKELFPNVIHYGPDDAILDALLPNMQDDFHVDQHVHDYFPGYYGYYSLLRGLKEHQDLGYKGILWVNFDVLINVARLPRLDKDNVWYTDRIGYMPMSAEGNHTQINEIALGWTKWFENLSDAFSDASKLYEKLPAESVDSYLSTVSSTNEMVIPFSTYKPWQHPSDTEAAGYGGDFIYVPFKHADRAIEFLEAADESNVFLEFTLPFLADWLRMECGMSVWEHTYTDLSVEYEDVVRADENGETLDVYHPIYIADEVDKVKWVNYLKGLYTL